MKHIVFSLLLFTFFESSAQQCSYVLKEGTNVLPVTDLDSTLELIYEIGSVSVNQVFDVQHQWIIMPDRIEEKHIIAGVDYEINPDTMLRIVANIPLEQLQCIEDMDLDKRDTLMLGILDKMYHLFSVDNNVHDANDSLAQVIYLKDYSPETRSFFYHSFYYAESYLGKDILWDNDDTKIWQQYLYNVSNNVWGKQAEGQHALAYLFAGKPALFCEVFKMLYRDANRQFIRAAIETYLPALLYTPKMQNGKSDLKTQFAQYKDRQADDRAALILNYYRPFLLMLGISEADVRSINKNKLQ